MLSLHVCYIQKKSLIIKWPNFTTNNEKKFFINQEKSLIGLAPGVNFINIFTNEKIRTNVVSAAFTTYMQLEKAAETTFIWKICTFNVDEIDTFLLEVLSLKFH